MTDFLAEAAANAPHRVAIDDGAATWTFAQLDARVAERENELRSAGAQPGRTVIVEAESTLPSLVTLHAVMRTGALLAPLDPALRPREREAALAALRPWLTVSGTDVTPASTDSSSAVGRHIPPGTVAVLWTSGTTGAPRGVLIHESGLRASAEATRRRLDLSASDRWYASLAPTHVGGLALLTRAAILGSRLLLRGRFSTRDLEHLVDSGSVTHTSLVPTMLRRLLDSRGDRPPPPSLRCVLLGGAHTPRDLLRRALDAGYPVALTYGMTEATSQVATAPPDLVRRKPGTVGPPLHGLEVRTGPDSGPSAPGRIHVRGPTVSPGLLDGTSLVDDAGWFATGDLGHVDAEGDLWISGRMSDRIISGGVNVDPTEVEQELRRHPAIQDACVIALPDPEWGEAVAALLVEKRRPDGRASDERTTLADVDAWVRVHLSPAKRPKRMRFVDALPLNRNGKIDRRSAALSFEES